MTTPEQPKQSSVILGLISFGVAIYLLYLAASVLM
jgi:hypothetical protein